MGAIYSFFALIGMLLQLTAAVVGAGIGGISHTTNILESILAMVIGSTSLTAAIPCLYLLTKHVLSQEDVSHKERGIFAAVAIVPINFVVFTVIFGSMQLTQSIFGGHKLFEYLFSFLLVYSQYWVTTKFVRYIKRAKKPENNQEALKE